VGGGWLYGREGNKYLHYNGSAWTREDFDDNAVVRSVSLFYLPSGAPFALYSTAAGAGGDLYAATRTAQGWDLELVLEDGTVNYAYFAVADDGTPHIVYNWSTMDDWGAKHTSKVGTNWIDEWVEHAAYPRGLAIDLDSQPATWFPKDYVGSLFSTRSEAGWQADLVDNEALNKGSIVIDRNGTSILVRYDRDRLQLHLSFRDSTIWTTGPFGPDGALVHELWSVLLTPEADAAVLYTYEIGESSRVALDTYW